MISCSRNLYYFLPHAHAPYALLQHSFTTAFAVILSLLCAVIYEIVICCSNGFLFSCVEISLTSRSNTLSEKMPRKLVSPMYESCVVLFLLPFHQSESFLVGLPPTVHDRIHPLSLQFVHSLNAFRSIAQYLEGNSFKLELKHIKRHYAPCTAISETVHKIIWRATPLHRRQPAP